MPISVEKLVDNINNRIKYTAADQLHQTQIHYL